MKLVDDWKRLYKTYSVAAMALSTGMLGAWQALPDEMKSVIPPRWLHYGILAVLVLGIIGRAVAQDSASPKQPDVLPASPPPSPATPPSLPAS